MTISDIVKNDSWSLAEGEHEGKPLYIRFRDEFRKKPNIKTYPRLIRVVWAYDSDEAGLPDADSQARMKSFESRLLEVVETELLAVLVAAITNNGQREWMFYTSDVAIFGKCLSSMPQEEGEDFPIDVTSERDPQWLALYEDILEPLG